MTSTALVSGGGVRAVVDPDRGGKIVSIVTRDGHEWLAQGIDRVPSSSGPAPAFVDGDMCGWDECAPTIDACTVGGRLLPDHGELWDRAFTVIDADRQQLGLETVIPSLGVRFTRRLRAIGPASLRLDYAAEALDARVPFLWAAHPQFTSPSGTLVRLPDQVETVVDVLDPALPVVRWDETLSSTDTLDPHACRKLYVSPTTSVSQATIVHPTGHSLTMSWTDECPYLGLWFDNQAYSREPVVALEPTTGYFDSLATAIADDRVSWLDPRRPLRWSIGLDLD